MYKSFQAINFRCFKEITLSSLERINLISGMNNVGKTSLLESLFLHAGAYNPNLIITINAFRGFDRIKLEFERLSENPWDSLFRNFNLNNNIKLLSVDDLNYRRSINLRVIEKAAELRKLRNIIEFYQDSTAEFTLETSDITSGSIKVLEFECKENRNKNKYYLILHKKGIQIEPIPPAPPFPGFYQSDRSPALSKEMAERFGNLEKYGKQEIVLNALKVIEPRLQKISMILVAEQPILHGDIGIGRLVPISLMGGGIVRLANLIIYIGNAENGVVLIDEIENGIHHSMMKKIWKSITAAARQFNTQIFATTHSWECIVSAHKSFIENGPYDFKLYRLEEIKDKIKAIAYDKDSLEAAIDAGLEVR